MKRVRTTIIRQSNSIQNRQHTTRVLRPFRRYFAVKERSFPVFLLIVPDWCFRVGDSWSCCLVVPPGPAAWSCCLVLLPGPAAWSCCLVLLPGPAAWSGLVLSDPAWFVLVLSGYLACRILVVSFSKIQQRPAANSRWAG
jgi:hypothetical protein